eukprot:gene3485-2185_t
MSEYERDINTCVLLNHVSDVRDRAAMQAQGWTSFPIHEGTYDSDIFPHCGNSAHYSGWNRLSSVGVLASPALLGSGVATV